jgi:hypothetical protein
VRDHVASRSPNAVVVFLAIASPFSPADKCFDLFVATMPVR